MAELVHKELSYLTVSVLFKVYNELGGGYQEKYYQRAGALEFKKLKIPFQEQVPVNLNYDGKNIGKYFIDFVVENKIVLEIKVAPRFYLRDVKQVLGYLKAAGLPLGISASFGRGELKFKRILKGETGSR
jgi:GxxExxY protein